MKKMKKIMALALACISVPGVFSGCGGSGEINFEDDPNKKVNLVMWVPTAGGLEPSDNSKVMSLVNNYLETVMPNTTLTLKYEDTNSFGAVMTRMFGAEETFDICFTSYGTNSYFDNAKDESFVGFTQEQMQEFAPDIWESTPQTIWDMIRVDGKYYAVINNQTKARQAGVSLDTAMLRMLRFFTGSHAPRVIHGFLAMVDDPLFRDVFAE